LEFLELEKASDTRNFFRRELSTLAQYLVIALAAGVGAFVWETSPVIQGQYANAINIGEAWRNFKPVLYSWFCAFTVFSLLRLLVVFVVKRRAGFR
jgi:uncharacterized BrkB/YihY/UPF0761 family membrane protein